MRECLALLSWSCVVVLLMTELALGDLSTGHSVSYITDVEGNIEYFRSFVKRSRVLQFNSADRKQDDSSNSGVSASLSFCGPNMYFVFGGDLFDKGPGDIRLARMLVGLKRRHPDRVFLLMGNRDINKLRCE